MLAFLNSLPISDLCVLDIEANKLYGSSNQLYDANLLTRGYTQHALCPYIDSEINHKRYFITITFVNKGMDFIKLPSICRSIPTYFQNTETPIICYKYNERVLSFLILINLFQISILRQMLLRPEIVNTQCIAIQQQVILTLGIYFFP